MMEYDMVVRLLYECANNRVALAVFLNYNLAVLNFLGGSIDSGNTLYVGHVGRIQTENHFVSITGVVVCFGLEFVDTVVAIHRTSPSPVEMEPVALNIGGAGIGNGVTVNQKCVTGETGTL